MLEEIYTKFTETVLPKIAEGLTITKDYFFDLFGRYVNYLLVIDSLLLFLCVFTVATAPIVFKKYVWKFIEKARLENKKPYCEQEDIWIGLSIVAVVIFLVSFISAFLGLFDKANDVAKDIFIPEVRVYEELSGYINK